jgi:Trp operon repressor
MRGPTKAQLEQIEQLLLAGHSKTEIAEALGTTRPTIDRWIGRCDPEIIAQAKEARGGSWAKIARPKMPALTPRDYQASHYVFPIEIDPLNELVKLNKEAWNLYNSLTAGENISGPDSERATRVLAEIRQQVQTAVNTIKQIYDMEVAKKFLQIVLEEVKQTDPGTYARIRQRFESYITDRTIGARTKGTREG